MRKRRGFSVQRVFVTLPEGHALARDVHCIHTCGLLSPHRCIEWHTEHWVRYCFYLGERFTLEPANIIELSVCKELERGYSMGEHMSSDGARESGLFKSQQRAKQETNGE